MDPVSAAASIIAVIQIATSVVSFCKDYGTAVTESSKEVEQIITELTSLKIVLEQILVVAEREKRSQPNTTFSLAKLTVPSGELEICSEQLLNLQKKLQPREGWRGLKDTLTWHFKSVEVRKTLDRLGKSKDTLNLAVTVDSALVSLSVQEETSSLAASFKFATLDAKQQQALDWFSSSTSYSKQNSARRKHQADTGTWFTASQQFADWKTENAVSLWLHGIPGCGKSILCSSIIEVVDQLCRRTPRTALAYFYFDFNNEQESSLTSLLRALVSQLAPQSPETLTLLVQEWLKHDQGRRPPSIPTLSMMLADFVTRFDSTFLIIDALDECTDREDLLNWIEGLVSNTIPPLHLLLSSRKEKNIDDVLKECTTTQVSIEDKDVDPDILIYVRNRLETDRKLQKWSLMIKEEIEKALMSRVSGMFRLADCQLDMLCKCNNVVGLRKQLQQLPRTLDSTYDQILANIDEDHASDALKVLQWLSFAARPLLLPEVVDVLAIDTQDLMKFDPDLRYTDPADILVICSSLVSMRPRIAKANSWLQAEQEVQELRLAHFSVKEYLTSARTSRGPTSFFYLEEAIVSSYLAENCLLYLLQFKEYRALRHDNISSYPLATYAAKHWVYHAKVAESHMIVGKYQNLAVTLLLDYEIRRNWLSLYIQYYRAGGYSDLEEVSLRRPVMEKDVQKPLYYACRYGLNKIAQTILDNGTDYNDLNEIAGSAGPVLHAAAGSGNLDLVTYLIGKGADVNAMGGWSCTAIQRASGEGHLEIVKLLLMCGADLDIRGGDKDSPLKAAVYLGDSTIVQLLLKHGADGNAVGGNLASPLAIAADRGHEEIVQILLDHGVNINKPFRSEYSPLQQAASHGPLRVVRLLVDKGADVNMIGGFGSTALCSAVRAKHTDIVQYLLEKGALPNVGYYGLDTSLSIACGHGQLDMVELLLKHGADPNLTLESGSLSPLDAAISKGRTDIIEKLLEMGADVKLGASLHAAVKAERLDIVRLLLSKGADVNQFGGGYRFPLHAAATTHRLDIVELLLKNGADVNERGGDLGTALSACCGSSRNSTQVAEYLIEQGAEINAQCGMYGSPLHAAAQAGSDKTEMVDLLLKYGADVNLRSGRFATALHSAVEDGNAEIVWRLLKAGADLEARAGPYGSPLSTSLRYGHGSMALALMKQGAVANWRNETSNDFHQAALWGLYDVVQKMLEEEGVDVNCFNGSSGTALTSSTEGGHLETMKLLIKHGANVNAQHDCCETPLYQAAASDRLDVVRLLIEAGANVNAEGGDYHTALQCAARSGQSKNVNYLLGVGANVNARGGKYYTALQAAAAAGDRNATKALLDAGARIDVQGGRFGNALQAAAQAMEGSLSVVKLLLDAGADVNLAGGIYGYPLQAAAQASNLTVVKLLLDRGANVNAKGGQYGTALLAAAQSTADIPEIVDILLACGADPMVSGPEGTALYHAAKGGHIKIIQTFLELGHDINSGWGKDGSALAVASGDSSTSTFRFLLGARLKESDASAAEASALLEAVKRSFREPVQLLLDVHTDVNKPYPDNYSWEPDVGWRETDAFNDSQNRHWIWCDGTQVTDVPGDESKMEASQSGVILENDIEADAESWQESSRDTVSVLDSADKINYTNALHEAVRREDNYITQMILSRTNDINQAGGKYGNALQAAISRRHLGLVRQLLDLGADMHATGGKYHTMLQAAASHGELRRVKLVHSYGLDVNSQGGKWGNALQAACQGGFLPVVRCLLGWGADVNARGGKYLCALQAAAHNGHLSVTQHLIEAGADVNLYDEELGDSLQAAASAGHFRLVQYLIKHKARGDRPSEAYKNALQAATDGGYLLIISQLIASYACFRRGSMYHDAIDSLTEGGFVKLQSMMKAAKDMYSLFGSDIDDDIKTKPENGE